MTGSAFSASEWLRDWREAGGTAQPDPGGGVFIGYRVYRAPHVDQMRCATLARELDDEKALAVRFHLLASM